ncbi:hypothetical protein B0H21DRAFT_813554 [Amylocystis lapponica]|nr:hypothetical protein B0H21DRAFT_813554 [Amylocystis lapponica]
MSDNQSTYTLCGERSLLNYSSTAANWYYTTLEVKRAIRENQPSHRLPAPSLYVKIRHADFKDKSSVIPDSYDPVWDKDFQLGVIQDPSSVVEFRLKHKQSGISIHNRCFGEVTVSITELLEKCKHEPGKINLTVPSLFADPRSKLGWSFEFQLMVHSDLQILQDVIDNLQQNDDTHNLLEKILEGTLSKLKSIEGYMDIIDQFVNIHPYAKTAWQIMSSLYQVVKAQQKRDENIVKLVQAIDDAIKYVQEMQKVGNKSLDLQNKALKLVQQIWQCALFAQMYWKHRFSERLAHQVLSNCTKTIQKMIETLSELKESVHSASIVHATIVFSQVSKKVEDMYLQNHLKPADMNAFYRGLCLANTRQEIIDSILDNLLDVQGDHRIVWMHGPAGCGKSTIATTIADHFYQQRHRGAFVFFDRSRAKESRPDKVIRTIAYQLGCYDQFVQSALAETIEQKAGIEDALPQVQFSALWVDSLKKAQDMQLKAGPVIIVIDALDECGSPRERQSLLQQLSQRIQELPLNYRFFVTSRPEPDIVKHFSEKDYIKEMHLDISSESNQRDVQIYLKESLLKIQRDNDAFLKTGWPGQNITDKLVSHAGGLFMWASTAIAFITRSPGIHENLLKLLSSSVKDKGSLYHLYETVLDSTTIWDDTTSMISSNWQKALGLIVIAKTPLTDDAIDNLLGLEGEQCSQFLFKHIKSLLQWSPGTPVQLMHASIADYLCDESECGQKPWFIHSAQHNQNLSKSCLTVMQRELHFNMCHLESSYVLNKDVKDLPQKIQDHISTQCSYSCQFWADHLIGSFNDDLCRDINEFFSTHLLYWLEALSLLRFSPTTAISMLSVWAMVCSFIIENINKLI